MELNKVYLGDSAEILRKFPDESVDCCVTSPPYYGLRDYGEEGQIGLEESPEAYIEKLVGVFREVKRVLKKDGTLWLNIGDSYWGGGWRGAALNKHIGDIQKGSKGTHCGESMPVMKGTRGVYKNKDLVGIPWMLAFALRADGWYLRQDIIWCLSGGAYLYVKSQKGVSPMMVKDLIRLDPKTVQLWNGFKWVNVFGYGESNDNSDKLELVLRSGERIGCTGGHKWVLVDGTEVQAKDLKAGDVLRTCVLPDSHAHTPSFFNKDLLWFLGLYIAEGSLSNDCIQIALNIDEISWVERISSVANHLGGTCTHSIDGNKLSVRVYSQVMLAVLRQYIGGHNAKTKHLNNICWQMPNEWLKEIVVGYLDGDGHYEESNNRYRLGFTRNYDLERDLRVLASRLGAKLTLRVSFSYIGKKKYESFKGEWRWASLEHWNNRERSEIVEIRKSRARHFYDISVDSEDHLFSLASGILTHNCKPNPMPESVTDRCTKSHEYVFLLSKSKKYWFDHVAIQEEAKVQELDGEPKFGGNKYGENGDKHYSTYSGNVYKPRDNGECVVRNKRDVWTVNIKPTKEAHFATYPEELVMPCILAGCRRGGGGSRSVYGQRNYGNRGTEIA